jgi:hypothetical protein
MLHSLLNPNSPRGSEQHSRTGSLSIESHVSFLMTAQNPHKCKTDCFPAIPAVRQTIPLKGQTIWHVFNVDSIVNNTIYMDLLASHRQGESAAARETVWKDDNLPDSYPETE